MLNLKLKYETPEFPNIGRPNPAAISAAARRRKAAARRGEYAGLNKIIPEDTSRRSNGPRKTDRRNYPDSVRPSMISPVVNGPQECDLNVSPNSERTRPVVGYIWNWTTTPSVPVVLIN